MRRPLKIDRGTTPISLKEMSDAEIEANIIWPILKDFAGASTGTGTIRMSTSTGGSGTSIGTWSDRTRVYSIGTHGTYDQVDDFTTTTYRLYQNLTLTNEDSLVRPLCFKYAYERVGNITRNTPVITMTDTSNLSVGMDVAATGIPSGAVIIEVNSNSITISANATSTVTGATLGIRRALVSMSDDDLYTHIILPALTKLVDGGLGSYYLSTSAPSTPSGATWTSQFSMRDRYIGGSSTKRVWRMTDSTSVPASITVRPIMFTEKNVNVLGDEGIQEMSDFEISSLVARFKNSIVTTGIGQYYLAPDAPSTGTWSTVGESITDFMNAIVEETYTSTYVNYFTRNYQKSYFGDYVGRYNGNASVGTYAVILRFGNSTNTGPGYTGIYTASYSGTYTGRYTSYRSAQITKSYTSYFTGQTISSDLVAQEVDALWIRQA